TEPVKYVVKKGTKDLSKAKIAFYEKGVSKAASKFGYTGGAVKPAKVVITFKDKTPVTIILDEEDSNYDATIFDKFDVIFTNNVNKGKATVIISSKTDEYVGGKSATFSIAAKSIANMFSKD
ncbi:MAG: hypothetical protein J1E98_15420, partial [Lachnospiraceae bacterium]|nr:hypothetical protein [Lachnospiraceae bacterium]